MAEATCAYIEAITTVKHAKRRECDVTVSRHRARATQAIREAVSIQPAGQPLARLPSHRPAPALCSIPLFVVVAPPGHLSLRSVKHKMRRARSGAARRVR
jgi:hypothetical protein